MEKERSSFTGKIGFVLAAAGSAVGLGNLWRFPYLAAKDGGGIFLFVYIILALTFGFTLMTTEIALGRRTRHSCIKAYGDANKKFGFLGPIASIVPILIFPYYCVIGGWVTKYTADYLTGNGINAVADGYFTGFITSVQSPIIWFLVFMGITSVVVFLGVEKGIEKISKILMPALCIIIVAIAVFSLTLKDEESGRTAIDGVKIYLIPDFSGITIGKFLRIVLDAMAQMFYSMSLAMGIMITYGSYSKRDTNLVSSVNQIEIFDTTIAILAGLIIVPTVFTFSGQEGLQTAGPGLLFVALPKIFAQMGAIGDIVGALFFVLVLFAALTSSISLLEANVSVLMDSFKMNRKVASVISVIIALVVGLVVCLGYNIWYFDYTLPNGSVGQILDILDYFTNNLLMPIVALLTCVLVGWVVGSKYIVDEAKLNGEKFGREGLYIFMVKWVAPLLLCIILISSFGVFDKI